MELNVEQQIEGGEKGRNSNTNCNSSIASFEDIPKEIQIEILSRLPPKPLSRCKRVSKHWNNTLTIQSFLLRQSRSYDKQPKLGFEAHSSHWGNSAVMSFELNDDNTPKTTVMTATKPKTTACRRIKIQHVCFNYLPKHDLSNMSNICNDLICLFHPRSTTLHLLNLQTGDFIGLQTIKFTQHVKSYYALGFDPVHKVFKILSINYGCKHNKCTATNAAILTVGSNYWNPIDYGKLPSSVVNNRATFLTNKGTGSVCLDGMIYWVHKNTIDDVIVLSVIAFDLNREAFRDNELIMTPMKNETFKYYLTSLKECPTLFIWKTGSDSTEEVEQWTLFNHKDPNASWKRRNIANHNFPKMGPYSVYGTATAGGSALLRYSEKINSESSWYLFHDLENFAIE